MDPGSDSILDFDKDDNINCRTYCFGFQTTNIPTLADGQKGVSKKVPEQGTNQKKNQKR